MPARDLIGAEFAALGAATATVASNATTALDFGTPDNLYVPSLVGWNPGDRLLLVLTAVRAAGTTSTLAWTVQDADDNAGAIGTPATAVTDGTSLAASLGSQQKVVGIKLQNSRPWLKVSVVHGGGGTDSYAVTAVLLAITSGL